ncbi:23S rRNA (guanosine(2251)-2'-O)-methyltransferase RlmB [Marinicaulis aureus]|uniref:23S rRNA (Guanosine(2251)-2'-O)-methyltransferase RlmB n=1 Tax=Hyphococcus aureus TaxID=2666033 RepID=A0ABW1L3F0_9PROT
MTQKHRAKPRKKTRKDGAAPGPGSDRGARPGPAPRNKGTVPKGQDGVWLYGRHAVAAALANPGRKINRVFATKNAADWLKDHGAAGAALARLEDIKPDEIDRLLHDGAVHQGLAALAEDLPRARLEDVCAPAEKHAPVLILDQITDPQNIGAMFRAAAAFGAKAVIVQDRRTPPLSGALAKAAAGAIEILPCIEVVNIARAIEALQEMGYFCAGLAGEAQTEIAALPDAPLALVMGAEGAGLRRLVAEKCDQLFRIPIAPDMESLNVSTAAAVSLYEVRRRIAP